MLLGIASDQRNHASRPSCCTHGNSEGLKRNRGLLPDVESEVSPTPLLGCLKSSPPLRGTASPAGQPASAHGLAISRNFSLPYKGPLPTATDDHELGLMPDVSSKEAQADCFIFRAYCREMAGKGGC